MDFKVDSVAEDILKALNIQRRDKTFCDVKLRVAHDVFHAHRCVLAAGSDYFRTLFLSNLDTQDSVVHVYQIPSVKSETIKLAIEFVYTGKIRINLLNVEDVLRVADFLGMRDIKAFCADLLKRHIDRNNCVRFKALVDQFSLEDIRGHVTDYVATRVVDLLRGSDLVDISYDHVYGLVSDYQLNFAKETQLLNFIFRWVHRNCEKRSRFYEKLIPFVDLSNISPGYIRRNVTCCQPIMSVLSNHQRKIVEMKLSEDAFPEKSEQVLFCCTRPETRADEAKILVYRIGEDTWYSVDNVPERHMFRHLRSMTTHEGALYLLVMRTPQYGKEESARIWRLDLTRGRWAEMTSPAHLNGDSRIVSHGRGLYIIDRTGVIEKYDNMNNSWMNYSGPSFDKCPGQTSYILPMPMDRYIYLLRGFHKPGTDNDHSSFCLQVHRYDTSKYTWDALYRIEPSERDIVEKERFSGYTATHSTLVLKNEFGLPRISYDFSAGRCTINKDSARKPVFVKSILGSTEHEQRVYIAVDTDTRKPSFMFYDHNKNRFKNVSSPPNHLTGVLCHGVAPRALRDTVTISTGDTNGGT